MDIRSLFWWCKVWVSIIQLIFIIYTYTHTHTSMHFISYNKIYVCILRIYLSIDYEILWNLSEMWWQGGWRIHVCLSRVKSVDQPELASICVFYWSSEYMFKIMIFVPFCLHKLGPPIAVTFSADIMECRTSSTVKIWTAAWHRSVKRLPRPVQAAKMGGTTLCLDGVTGGVKRDWRWS